MNRFNAEIDKLRNQYDDRPPAGFIAVHFSEEVREEEIRIFGRLKDVLRRYDELTREEVALIQRVLHFRAECTPFESWVIDLYLIRAHTLEICRWPVCGLFEFPEEMKEAFDHYGPKLLNILRRTAV